MERKPKYILSSCMLEKQGNGAEEMVTEQTSLNIFYTCDFVNIKIFDINMKQI